MTASLPAPEVIAAIAIVGYLIGSIPFGLVFSHVFGLGDVRKIGSGNIGATNVLRTGSKLAAALTLIFDAGKGALAILITRHWFAEPMVVMAAACVVLGHVFPIWLKFKGGKGVATSAGLLLALAWPVGTIVILTWIATVFITRLSSLAALLAALVAPVAAIIFAQPLHVLLAIFLTLTVFLTHCANIRRLMEGTEPRVVLNKKST